MFKRISTLTSIVCFVGILTACVHQPLIKHDEVLIYNRAYDYVYDAVLRALDNADPWQLGTTDKGRGMIAAYNTRYWDSLDADKRTALILIKAVDRKRTSVELSPESQRVIGVGRVLKKIKRILEPYK